MQISTQDLVEATAEADWISERVGGLTEALDAQLYLTNLSLEQFRDFHARLKKLLRGATRLKSKVDRIMVPIDRE